MYKDATRKAIYYMKSFYLSCVLFVHICSPHRVEGGINKIPINNARDVFLYTTLSYIFICIFTQLTYQMYLLYTKLRPYTLFVRIHNLYMYIPTRLMGICICMYVCVVSIYLSYIRIRI